MADLRHLGILNQLDDWDKWREDKPEVKPDLTEANLSNAHLAFANLSGADLTKANLNRANLFFANLAGANLSRADLTQSNLTFANLKEATLAGTYLSWASISKAILTGANFSEAYLTNANLESTHLVGATLTGANLIGANLKEADLTGADLSGANLKGASLAGAVLTGANFTEAELTGANLFSADLTRAILISASLSSTNLTGADLIGANLTGVDLSGANLIEADFTGSNLTNCRIYGIAAWDLKLKDSIQVDLIITKKHEPIITVDNIQVAQFIYLLLNNVNVRQVIDTITSKVVLILGRFTSGRKGILDALREELRRRNYSPILFDFEKPACRDITETISTLAHMARFVIADITDAKSIPQELQRIVPDLPSLPIVPLLHGANDEYGMFEHFKRYPWVLETYQYETQQKLIEVLGEAVITPAEAKVKELRGG